MEVTFNTRGKVESFQSLISQRRARTKPGFPGLSKDAFAEHLLPPRGSRGGLAGPTFGHAHVRAARDKGSRPPLLEHSGD